MDNKNIERFELLMEKITRPGTDKLMDYIRKSDFYTAPASTKYHLSCEGGLLQHSLNVYDATCKQLKFSETGSLAGTGPVWEYYAAGHKIAEFPEDTIIVTTLLHDICKTRFYTVDYKNQKVYKDSGSKYDAGGRFDWERVPFYTVDDKNPYGHGEKSVMMISEFIRLTMEERYAIRWHMGYANENYSMVQAISASIEKYPLVFVLQTADMIAAHFMEEENGNKPEFSEK